MTSTQFILFITAFLIPVIYQRVKRRLRPTSFNELTSIRKKSRLNIHHGHWGLLLILGSALSMAFFSRGTVATTLLGLGCGLLFDELIPHLKEESHVDRARELEHYDKSLPATILFMAVMCVVFTVLYFVS